MTLRINLDQCGQRQLLHAVSAGNYVVEYTDSTHTADGEWLKLGDLNIRGSALDVADDGIEQFYTLGCNPGPLPPIGGNANQSDRRLRTLEDTLALALGRVGLLTPEVSDDLLAELIELNEEDGVVIVPDTNALHNGAVHWLLRVLRGPSVWLMPVVASLTTVQTRDAMVKELVGKRAPNKLVQALRSRGLVNGALGLLQRNRGRSQVVEIDPSLLRYQKQASNNGMDPDQSDVLEDRLIIEAIHGVLRSMRSRSARRVVTSDVNIARVLEAEGIRTLFIPTIILPRGPIACLRFDALARTFVGAPLRALLWELTHVFGTLRLRREDGYEPVRLECYWPGKTPAQWTSEMLTATFTAAPLDQALATPGVSAYAADATNTPAAQENIEAGISDSVSMASSVPDGPNHLPNAEPISQSEAGADQSAADFRATADAAAGGEAAGPSPLEATDAKNRSNAPRITMGSHDRLSSALTSRERSQESRATFVDTTTAHGVSAHKPSASGSKATRRAPPKEREIGVVLPRASLPQMFTLLAASRRVGAASAAEITVASSSDPITVDNARRAMEILKRIGLLKQDGEIFLPTPTADILDKALTNGDLDALSSLMLRFEPYAQFLALLQHYGRIPKSEVTGELRRSLGKVGSYESERLPRFHILLGQAWQQGDTIVDGSQRPTDRDATDAFERAFNAAASDGIASVIDLLRFFCEDTKMSPWASKRKIEGFVRQNLLSNYSFQTAAGRRPITADAVLSGTLDRFILEPVVIDRLQLGQRPVFTIERIAR